MANDDSGDGRRRRLDGVIPELIKRAVEIGVEKATEYPDAVKHLVGELKLPKEAAAYVLQQVDDTKNGVMRVAAKEMRDFLQTTNLAGEIKKALTTLQFEINTTIRFTPNDAPDGPGKAKGSGAEGAAGTGSGAPAAEKLPKPEVKTEIFVKRDGERPREYRRSQRAKDRE